MSHFDWYSGSFHGDHRLVVNAAEDRFRAWVEKTGKGRNSFESSLHLRADRGFHAHVQWGGVLHRDLVHVSFSGGRSGEGAQLLRDVAPQHRVSRVDVAEDVVGPGALAQLSELSMRVARDHNVKRTRIVPDDGRLGETIYLGSRLSPVFGRIYEKGKQLQFNDHEVDLEGLPVDLQGHDLDTWVRAEIEVKPKSHAKKFVAGLSPLEVWGCSHWAADFYKQFQGIELPRVTVGSVWKADDVTRTMNWLVSQYGPFLRLLRDREGSWEGVGVEVGKNVEARRHLRGRGGVKRPA